MSKKVTTSCKSKTNLSATLRRRKIHQKAELWLNTEANVFWLQTEKVSKSERHESRPVITTSTVIYATRQLSKASFAFFPRLPALCSQRQRLTSSQHLWRRKFAVESNEKKRKLHALFADCLRRLRLIRKWLKGTWQSRSRDSELFPKCLPEGGNDKTGGAEQGRFSKVVELLPTGCCQRDNSLKPFPSRQRSRAKWQPGQIPPTWQH